jgi:Cu-Zn family superoxide dismutase
MPRRVASALLGLSLISCASVRSGSSSAVSSASATLRDASGATVGTASLSQTAAGVLVSASLTGPGSGTHGMHVHETGRCEPPAFASAGGHFNPEHKQHGFRNPAGPHAGDMPNVSLPQGSGLTFDVLLPRASLGGKNGLLDADGAAIVVHASADDYQTDPAGNSGPRLACGVIVAR